MTRREPARSFGAMNPRAIRTLAIAGMTGAVCWTVMTVSALLTDPRPPGKVSLEGTSDYLGFANFAAALALTVCALLALHLHHRGADGRLGRIAASVAMAGCAGQCLVITTIAATGEEPWWFGIAAPVAIFTWFAGSIAFGVAIRRARVLPGWVGAVLPVVTLFAIVGSEAGTSLMIAAFLVVVGRRLVRATSAEAAPKTAALGPA